MKFGALSPCDACRKGPATEEELITSLALTDHYLREATLKEVGARIAAGNPVQVDEVFREKLRAALRRSPSKMNC